MIVNAEVTLLCQMRIYRRNLKLFYYLSYESRKVIKVLTLESSFILKKCVNNGYVTFEFEFL